MADASGRLWTEPRRSNLRLPCPRTPSTGLGSRRPDLGGGLRQCRAALFHIEIRPGFALSKCPFSDQVAHRAELKGRFEIRSSVAMRVSCHGQGERLDSGSVLVCRGELDPVDPLAGAARHSRDCGCPVAVSLEFDSGWQLSSLGDRGTWVAAGGHGKAESNPSGHLVVGGARERWRPGVSRRDGDGDRVLRPGSAARQCWWRSRWG